MPLASVRTILPLSLVTSTSMLAMDLYLPAVPHLQQSLGIDITLAQATVAMFLAGLAASQLLWGEALNRIGPAGPVLGALLLLAMDWRGTFWILAGSTALVLPFVVRITPRHLPGLDRTVPSGYGDILRNGRFARLALSHALCIGALLMFVASAPQLMRNALGLETSAFAALQVIGVSAFIVVASQSARIAARLGTAKAVWLGVGVQLALCAALLAIGSLGTQLVAPFMAGTSVAPIAAGMLAMLVASAALVTPYPAITNRDGSMPA